MNRRSPRRNRRSVNRFPPAPFCSPEDAARASGRAAACARRSSSSISSGAEPCCARPPRASRRLFRRANIWAVTNVEQAAAVRARIARRSRFANSRRAVGTQHRRSHRPRRHSSGPRAWRRADGRAPVRRIYRRCRAISQVWSAPRSSSRARREISWSSAFRPRAPKPATAISNAAGVAARPRGVPAYAVRRFTEKPALPLARKYVSSGKYFWNAGMFFWRASTFLENLQPVSSRRRTTPCANLRKSIGTPRYASALRAHLSAPGKYLRGLRRDGARHALRRQLVARLRDSRQDRLERHRLLGCRLRIACRRSASANVSAGPSFTLDADGNYLWSPKKFVAAIGVQRSRPRRNRRRPASLPPRPLAGRRQNREVARGKKRNSSSSSNSGLSSPNSLHQQAFEIPPDSWQLRCRGFYVRECATRSEAIQRSHRTVSVRSGSNSAPPFWACGLPFAGSLAPPKIRPFLIDTLAIRIALISLKTQADVLV